MHRISWIFRREYKTSVKSKGFIIGLVMAPIFVCGSLVAFLLLKDKVDTNDQRAVIIDRSGVVAEAIIEAAQVRNRDEIYNQETGKKTKPAYLFETIEPNIENPEQQKLELSNQIKNNRYHAFIEIGTSVVHPSSVIENNQIYYYSKNAAMDDMRQWISWPINNQLRRLRLTEANIDQSTIPDLFHWVNVNGLELVSVDASTGDIQEAKQVSELQAILVPLFMMMLMFMMIMMNVPGMLQSVMEEKTQRISEVLLGAVSPVEFMFGKLLSGVAVAITISAVYFICGMIVVNYIGFQSLIPYHILPWFLVYMILAIVMFGAFAAALGSACSEPKDAQSLTFPVIFPVIFPMFVYFPILKEPLGDFATILSLIPFFTPTLMTLRMATLGGVPLWQPIVGLFGMLLFTFIFVWFGARIFRVGILMQGMPPKLKNIIKWAIQG
jgi:ABC-type Na+ efflux pump permease subunit